MIAIGNLLVSDALVEEQFICDLHKCKGGCCVDGDAGAPLEESELAKLEEVFQEVKSLLSSDHLAEIEKQGLYVHNKEFGWVTPAINGGICIYANTDPQGIVKCAIEQAFYDGKTTWKKPISCHLFPVRIKKSKSGKQTYVNYEPRPTLCKPACQLGKKQKLPVYQFVREALIRKFGQSFYDALHAVATDYFKIKPNAKQ
jgi:hypothetical protein